MSEFTGEGFKPFPNTHSDLQEASKVVEWDDARLERKVHEYGHFLTRDDIMERARKTGALILDRLMFELACRDGIYDDYREDELCVEPV